MRHFVTPFILAVTAVPALAAEGGSKFPPFNSSTFAGQLFWLAITFGTLYWLMSRIALPRIASVLETREATIEGALAAAAEAQKASETEAAALEAALVKAKSNAQGIALEARAKSSREIDAKRQAVESDLSAKMIAAEASIAATKARAMENVDGIAKDAVAAMVEALTGKAPTAAAVTKAVGAARGE